jgi:hypothetical protein
MKNFLVWAVAAAVFNLAQVSHGDVMGESKY